MLGRSFHGVGFVSSVFACYRFRNGSLQRFDRVLFGLMHLVAINSTIYTILLGKILVNRARLLEFLVDVLAWVVGVFYGGGRISLICIRGGINHLHLLLVVHNNLMILIIPTTWRHFSTAESIIGIRGCSAGFQRPSSGHQI